MEKGKGTCGECGHYLDCQGSQMGRDGKYINHDLKECPARTNEREMLKALEAAEWGGRIQDDEACPVCDMNSYSGHAPDCILSAALKKAKEE